MSRIANFRIRLLFVTTAFLLVGPMPAQAQDKAEDKSHKAAEKKETPVAAFTLTNTKNGKLVVVDHKTQKKSVVNTEDLPEFNKMSREAVEREAILRQQREDLSRDAVEQRMAERAAEEAEAARLEEEGLRDQTPPPLPRAQKPVEKNWVTLTPYHKGFPTHLVDEKGNPIPLPDPNPRKQFTQPAPKPQLESEPMPPRKTPAESESQEP